MIEDLVRVTPGNVRCFRNLLYIILIKSLYNNILGMFEVFNSVQIKPFYLKIGINNTKRLHSDSLHFLRDDMFRSIL